MNNPSIVFTAPNVAEVVDRPVPEVRPGEGPVRSPGEEPPNGARARGAQQFLLAVRQRRADLRRQRRAAVLKIAQRLPPLDPAQPDLHRSPLFPSCCCLSVTQIPGLDQTPQGASVTITKSACSSIPKAAK